MKNGKPTGGYDRLKIKYAELEAKVADKQKTVEEQERTISRLTAEKACVESEAKYYEAAMKNYWLHMGWFKRWLWGVKHHVIIK